MKQHINKIQLAGNAGNSPEIKVFDNNKLAKFSLATTEKYKNKNGELVDQTQWHNITAWGKVADDIQKLVEKGKFVSVQGKIVNRSYTDKEGNKRYITEVVASEITVE